MPALAQLPHLAQVAIVGKKLRIRPIRLMPRLQKQRRIAQREHIHHPRRNHPHQLHHIRRQQQLLTELIQPLRLSPSPVRDACLLLRPVRQVARQDPRRQKRQQRHPVLRVRDGERQKRWQKEKVEAQRRQHRHINRDPQPPPRRHKQNRNQQRQRHRGRVHMQIAKVQQHNRNHHHAGDDIRQNLGKQALLHPCIIARAHIQIPRSTKIRPPSSPPTSGCPIHAAPVRHGWASSEARPHPQKPRHLDRSSEQPPRSLLQWRDPCISPSPSPSPLPLPLPL